MAQLKQPTKLYAQNSQLLFSARSTPGLVQDMKWQVSEPDWGIPGQHSFKATLNLQQLTSIAKNPKDYLKKELQENISIIQRFKFVSDVLVSINAHYHAGQHQISDLNLHDLTFELINWLIQGFKNPKAESFKNLNELWTQSSYVFNAIELLVMRNLLIKEKGKKSTIPLGEFLMELAKKINSSSDKLNTVLSTYRLMKLIDVLRNKESASLMTQENFHMLLSALGALSDNKGLGVKRGNVDFLLKEFKKETSSSLLLSTLGKLSAIDQFEQKIPAKEINTVLKKYLKLKDLNLSEINELFGILIGVQQLAENLKISPIDSLNYTDLTKIALNILTHDQDEEKIYQVFNVVCRIYRMSETAPEIAVDFLGHVLDALNKKLKAPLSGAQLKIVENSLMMMGELMMTHQLHHKIAQTRLNEKIQKTLEILLNSAKQYLSDGEKFSNQTNYIHTIVHVLRARMLIGITLPDKTSEALSLIVKKYLFEKKSLFKKDVYFSLFKKDVYFSLLNQYAGYLWLSLPEKENLPKEIQSELAKEEVADQTTQIAIEKQLLDNGFKLVHREKAFGHLRVDIYAEVEKTLSNGEKVTVRCILEIDGKDHFTKEGRIKNWLRNHILYYKSGKNFDVLLHYPVLQKRHYPASEFVNALNEQIDIFLGRKNLERVESSSVKEIKEDSPKELYEKISQKKLKKTQLKKTESDAQFKKRAQSILPESQELEEKNRLECFQMPVSTDSVLATTIAVSQEKERVIEEQPMESPKEIEKEIKVKSMLESNLSLKNMNLSNRSMGKSQRLKHRRQREKAKKEAKKIEQMKVSQEALQLETKQNKPKNKFEFKGEESEVAIKDIIINKTKFYQLFLEQHDVSHKVLVRLAECGEVKMQYDLATYYLHQASLKKNNHKQMESEGMYWLLLSAEGGNAEAQLMLSYRYYVGEGVPKNREKAISNIKKLAEEGIPEAQYVLGLIYQHDIKNLTEAFQCYFKAAEQEFVLAQSNLGYCYQYEQGVKQDLSKAVEYYRKAAEQGYALAQHNLGYCYQFEQGVEKDLSKAVEYYRKAAEQGLAQAQNNLGSCYFYAQGVDKDLQEAVKYFKKASAQDFVEAEYGLYLCYSDETWEGKDLTEAIKWCTKAAEQGHKVAQYHLAVIYQNALKGCSRDSKKAVEWYEKSAIQDIKEAQYNLAVIYHHGDEHVSQDLEKAVYWYEKAAEQGMAEAQNNLGVFYKLGLGGKPEDLKKAFQLYEASAKKGYSVAQYNLASFYEHGLGGVSPDLEEAMKWYQKSAAQGYKEAQSHLEELERVASRP